MTRPLGTRARALITGAEQSQAWKDADKDRLRLEVEWLRDAYPMADVRLAQFLTEVAIHLEDIIAGPDEDLRGNLLQYQTRLMLLAAAVSRKVRGRAPL